MTDALDRPLAGLKVGFSVSESKDSVRLGFPPWQVNHVTLQMAAAFMGQGIGVVFGHDWREDGVMEAVHAFALQMQVPDAPAADGSVVTPLMQNLLPWPDEPKLPQNERARLASTLSIEQAGLPEHLFPPELQPLSDAHQAYLRARGLTHLRRKLTERTHARVCLGGRTGGSKGRYPGIVEEAYLSVNACQPLFLAGFLGGATSQVIDAFQGRPRPSDFGSAPHLSEIYSAFARPGKQGQDAEIDPDQVWYQFGSLGVRGLSRLNGLTETENRELFSTPAVERATQLVLLGLARIKREAQNVNPSPVGRSRSPLRRTKRPAPEID